MFWVLIILNIIIAIVLTTAVMMQASKGDGLTGSLGGSSFGTVFGVRRTADFLQKFTIGLAAAFLVISLVVNMWFLPTGAGVAGRNSVLKDIQPPTPGQLPPMQESQPAAPGAPPQSQQ
ncbi:MAG TPA: preprotein translocase subunit SecG [Candidatus Kapabacteria bacterium]|nr:preprotein translocase subunit SecG [Candidatus Kapabacteria bacterium]